MSYKNVGVICRYNFTRSPSQIEAWCLLMNLHSDCQRRIALESQSQAVHSLGGVRLGKSVLEPIHYIAALISV
ncbi:hypothetical protein T03_16533 [Trichinella britovi]|uniref:Uncharacterized protein n=1 Tax=Trichinella britovi TaxID=45882 RepID=A0A0V1C6E4_TRIBR|nr:hypothetical protein T03_16533 [Trichinella britovi]